MLKNTPYTYGLVTIFLHWIMAVLIIGLFILGLYMTGLSYYDVNYRGSFFWHETLGILTLFLLILRFFWRLMNIQPSQTQVIPPWQEHVARLVHWLFYVLIAVICVSGYLISTAEGQALNVGGLFKLPAVSNFETGFANTVGIIHWYAAIIIIAITVVHTTAAFFHHLVLKDNVLRSIVKGVKNEK